MGDGGTGVLLRADFRVHRTLAGFGIEHAAKFLANNSGLKGYVFIDEDGVLCGTVEGGEKSVVNFGLWLEDIRTYYLVEVRRNS